MLRFIQNLDPNKFEHIVVLPDTEGGINQELSRCSNCRIIFLNLRSLRISNFTKLFRLLKSEKIDLIHSHGKAAGLYGRILSKLSGMMITHHLHGIHYRQYPKPFQKGYFLLEKILSRWSQKIICVSHSEQEEGIALGLFDAEQSVIVPNGVDTDHFLPRKSLQRSLKQQWGIPEDGKVIFSITRSCYQKNPELTLLVHAEVCKYFPNTFLLMIGIDSDDKELQEKAESLGTLDRTKFVQGLSNMHELLNIGDLYLSTSRWEGLSLGVVEAMSVGLPAVLSKVVGHVDIQKNGGEGVKYISRESPKEYAEVIINLLLNKKIAARAGQQARAQVRQAFNLSNSIKMLEQQYWDLINRS